jgi:hypothetical protein
MRNEIEIFELFSFEITDFEYFTSVEDDVFSIVIEALSKLARNSLKFLILTKRVLIAAVIREEFIIHSKKMNSAASL